MTASRFGRAKHGPHPDDLLDGQLVRVAYRGGRNVDLAASINVSIRTLERWRSARPALNRAIMSARTGDLIGARRELAAEVADPLDDVEAAVARGLTNSQIMDRLDVDYEMVRMVRDRLAVSA